MELDKHHVADTHEHEHSHPDSQNGGAAQADHDLDHHHADDHGHGHDHPHDHPHNGDAGHDDQTHGHDHPHDHDHEHRGGVIGTIESLFIGHRHETNVDASLEGSAEGIRAVKLSLAGLAVTAAIQLAIVLLSGSAGLLADTIHNFSDALTAIPLGLAFVVGRRPANTSYTYGYGRAEDLAGVAVVLIIFASAVLAFWESLQRLFHPAPLPYVGVVMAAAVVGFLGNEGVAWLRTRTGRKIGSAALEADGQHARADGYTSLGVLVGAVAVWLGAPIADPIVGMLISVAILVVSKDTAVAMWRRLMDAVDPSLVARVERAALATPGVQSIEDLRVRWLGHRLWAELHAVVDEDLPLRDAHAVAEDLRHRLYHAVPQLAETSVHLDPCGHSGADAHAVTQHHQ
jgi:cation diffusion facilitator family transporter